MAITAGRYYIVCSVVSHFYGTLALQRKDDGSVRLIPFGSEPGTLWNVITNHDGTQAISPNGHPDLQTVSVDGVIRTLSSAKQGWVIKITDGTCTVSDGTARWEVQLIIQDDQPTPVPGGEVTVGTSSESVSYLWWFLPVPTC